MPARTSVSPKVTISVDGAPLEARVAGQLIELAVDQRCNAADLFRLVFHDPQLLLTDADTFKSGKAVKIEVEVDPQSKGVLTVGEVTTVRLEDDAWGTQLTVEGMNRGHRMFRDRIAEVYKDVTYTDVVRKIGQRNGLSVQATATTTVHQHLGQNNLTDWEFLQLIADELGWDVWVADRALHFDKPAETTSGTPVELTRGENLVHLGVVVTGGGQTAKEVQVRGWDHKQQRAVVGTAPAAQTVGASIGTGTAAAVRGDFNAGKVVVTDTPFVQQAEADVTAKAVAEQVASGFVELTGAAGGDPRLKARCVVDIKGAGRRFSGKYVLTQVHHVWDAEAGYRTEFTVTGRHDRSLYALAGGAASAAPQQARIHGLVVGVVTDVKDPENVGRVKVKLPWMADNYEIDWARVTQLIGGSTYGSLFMPDVNDEVLVGFEHGDIRRPYVLGSLYSGKNKPEKASDQLVSSNGKVATQRLETRERNRLVFFDDRGNKEGVTLRTGDDKFFIDLNKTQTKITISSDGDVTIEATKGKVLIDAKDVELKASGTLDATATGAATISSSAKLTLEGAAGVELKSSGMVEVKGAMVKLN